MAGRNIAEVAVGAAILTVAAAFLIYAVASSGRASVTGYPLYAKFDHIDGLTLGSDVRIAGVKVGAVTAEKIDPQSFQAVVTMEVQDGLELPTDTAAEVTSDGLLGGKYLSLAPGGATTNLKSGGTITVTQGSVSLEQLLGKFIFSVTNMVDATKSHGSNAEQPPAPNPATPGGGGK